MFGGVNMGKLESFIKSKKGNIGFWQIICILGIILAFLIFANWYMGTVRPIILAPLN